MKKNSIIKIKKGQQINPREINLINSGVVEGFLCLNVKSNKHSVKLNFSTDGLVGLQDFIQMNKMTKRLFVILLRNVVVALKSVESNKLSHDLIIWDLNTSYVDPASWHVYLTYVPLQPYELTGNLKTFIQQIIAACNFSDADDVTYVQELVTELNDNVAYTVGRLEDYCNLISEDLVSGQTNFYKEILCPVCKAKLTSDETQCPFCGAKVLRNNAVGRKETAVPQRVNAMPVEKDNEVSLGNPTRTSDSISVNEDENGVVTVFRGAQRMMQCVWIEDCSSAGKTCISKFPFRIGKMEGITDYRIYNNRVSRKHADILKGQGRFFIVDLDSTNGTYLNKKRLQPGVKEELHDGDLFDLADSRFKFHID